MRASVLPLLLGLTALLPVLLPAPPAAANLLQEQSQRFHPVESGGGLVAAQEAQAAAGPAAGEVVMAWCGNCGHSNPSPFRCSPIAASCRLLGSLAAPPAPVARTACAVRLARWCPCQAVQLWTWRLVIG